jgi:MoaA/NifB/PqqE/SkfB family radical SAM enzyme
MELNRDIVLPKPSRDEDLYSRVLAEGFRCYPEREANWSRFRNSVPSEQPEYSPVMLDVENVSRCNFRCLMCQVREWKNGRRAADMELSEFKRILDTQPGLVEIKLQGMGEPFLGRDFIDMVRYARSRHLWVRSTTNGSLLHVKENYKRIIDADICEIQVSLDGATPEAYEKVRGGGDFQQVTKNAEMLNKYASDVDRMRTRMWVVVQAANSHELEELPKLAANLGFTRLTLSLDLNDWGQEDWKERNDPLDVHRDLEPERLLSLAEAGRRLGVEVTFWLIDEKFEPGNLKKLCPWPFSRAYISSDLRIVPCCMIANPEVMDLGDAKQLKDVWNGDVLRHFRHRHLHGDVPTVCRSCYTTPSSKR